MILRRSILTVLTIGIAASIYGVDRPACSGCPPEVIGAIEKVSAAKQSAPEVEAYIRAVSDLGYLDVSMSETEDGLHLNPGKRYHFEKIVVAGDTSFVINVSSWFTPDNLSVEIERLLEHLYERGYYYAAALPRELQKSGTGVTVRLKIGKGPVLTLGQIRFTGLKRTDQYFLARFTGLRSGEKLTPKLLRTADARLLRVPFVRYRPPARIIPRAGYTSADLEFQISEPRQFLFEGGIGYAQSDQIGLVWSIKSKLRNLFGRGREVGILSERKEKGRNIFDITYGQPLFLVGRDRIELRLASRDYRDLFYEISAAGLFKSHFGSASSVGFGLDWKNVEPATDSRSFSRFGASIHFSRQSLDSPGNPVTGMSFESTIRYSHRRYSAGDSINAPVAMNETRTAASVEIYRSLTPQIVGRLSFSYDGLETSEEFPPLSELILVGGPGSLRGYRNEQFAVVRAAYGTFEPRWRFHGGFLFAFYDAAYLNNRMLDASLETRTVEFYRSGFGVGMSLTDGRRSVLMSFGWNRDLPFDEPRLSIEFSSDI